MSDEARPPLRVIEGSKPTHEERKEEGRRDDILVHPGDMTACDADQVVIDKDYESMVEDYIGNFNHMLVQGVPPMTALFAFAQSFALVLGQCIRSGLRVSVAGKLIGMIVKNSTASAQLLKLIKGD